MLGIKGEEIENNVDILLQLCNDITYMRITFNLHGYCNVMQYYRSP